MNYFSAKIGEFVGRHQLLLLLHLLHLLPTVPLLIFPYAPCAKKPAAGEKPVREFR